MTVRYVSTLCSCGRRYGVNGNDIHSVRASRTRLDDSAASWGTARDRVESEASEPLPVADTPVSVMPPARRRRVALPGSVGGHSLGER